FAFIDKWAEYANREYGFENATCFTSNKKNLKLMGRLAARSYINQIGTDPYYTNRPGENNDSPDKYVGGYAARLQNKAGKYNKQSQIFVQMFDLKEGWEDVPLRAAEAAIKTGIRRIGCWGCINWAAAEMDFGYPDI